MTYKDKKRKTDHHVIGMADSMPQKKRRSVKWKPCKMKTAGRWWSITTQEIA